MEMRRVTIFPYQQCPLPQRQHDKVMACFPLVLTQESLVITAKNQGNTKDDCRKLKRKRNLNATTASLPKKSTQSARLVTNRTTRPNDVGKALELTSSLKTLNLRTPQLTIRPPVKGMPKINRQRQF